MASRDIEGQAWYSMQKVIQDLKSVNDKTDAIADELRQKFLQGKPVILKSKEPEFLDAMNDIYLTEVEFKDFKIKMGGQCFKNQDVSIAPFEQKFNLKDFQSELFEGGYLE